MARVLLYNFTEEERRRKVKAALFRAAVPAREIPAEEQDAPLGFLLGLEGFSAGEKTSQEPFREEMIVMHALEPRQFQRFLEGLKSQGIRVPLKAVVTEHNIRWTSRRLREELKAEHEALSAGGNAPVHGREKG